MDSPKKFVLKECSVILEPITPQKQLALSAELKNVINERNVLTTRTKNKVLKALDEINSPEKPNPLKEQALEELLNSEVSYLKQLEILTRFFIEPIKEKNLLSKEDFETVFGDIETIYGVNGELLRELKRDSSNVGQAFKNMAHCFKLYSMYAYGYKHAMDLLQNKSQKKLLAFSKFVEQQESRPEVQSKLSALLIAPIQRIPRYRLLLKQILDYTSPVDGDFLALKSALKMIEEAAKHINRLVEQQERTQEMLELQRSLVNQQPSFIKPGRYIVKQGILQKMAKNGAHSYKRYFILMNDIIMYCKMKGSTPKNPRSLVCSAILPLSKCKISEIKNKGCFKINCQEEELIFYDTRLTETQDWIKTLNETIKRYLDNRHTLKKENTIRRPIKRKHFDEFESADLSPGKPLRKRLILEKEDYENLYKNASDSDDENSTGELKNCFRISKRKSIRRCVEAEKSLDSLYPMRAEISENILNGTNDAKTCDLFVFGSNHHENRGFSFRMGNFFRNVINMFKRN